MVKIYLDAGHGGSDSGAVGNDILEKNIVLALAQKIEELLKRNYENVEVMQTRTTDVFLPLGDRTKKANTWKADCFVSLHCNAHTQNTAKGFETYIYTNPSQETIAFQNVMHGEILRAISGVAGIVDKGKKQANFHVLRETGMKAILTENLFISNHADASLLKSEPFLDKLAIGHVKGLERFFGLQKKEVAPPEKTTLYQIICGTFSSMENAERQVEKLEADGYKAYIQKKE